MSASQVIADQCESEALKVDEKWIVMVTQLQDSTQND
jgi:hypothetical protein